jgi:hypothetical protein
MTVDNDAAVLRAVGLLRAYMVDDDDLLSGIINASRTDDSVDPQLVRTIAAMVVIAATLVKTMAAPDGDVDQILDQVQHHLVGRDNIDG